MCFILDLLLQLISFFLGRKIPKMPREVFLPVLNLQSEIQATTTTSMKYLFFHQLAKKILLIYLLAAATMSFLGSFLAIPINHERPQKFFQGGQSRHFGYPFQVSDDATQTDVHKTLYLCYTTKKMPNVTSTVANCAHSKTWFSTFFMQQNIVQPNLTWRSPSENFQ